jgi:hypothetical protein
VEAFLNKHAGDVIGVLSGFDRLVFRGTLRMLAHHLGMMTYLRAVRVLLKDFASHAAAVTQQLRAASEGQAKAAGRPIVYVRSSAISKEDLARRIARRDGIERGLICIIKAVEPCVSYDIIRDRKAKRLHLRPKHRKCLFLYHYQIHPIFGFMHARIQDLVSLPHPGLSERPGVAGTDDGLGRPQLRAAGQLLYPAAGPGAGAAADATPGGGRLA